MTALTVSQDRAELIRLAYHANSFPNAALSPVLDRSVLDRIETAAAFDRLRAALDDGDQAAAKRALDELTGGAR